MRKEIETGGVESEGTPASWLNSDKKADTPGGAAEAASPNQADETEAGRELSGIALNTVEDGAERRREGGEEEKGEDPILGGVRRLLEEYVESGDMAEDFAKLGETPMARLSFADRLMNYTTPKRKAVDVSGEIAVENEMSDVLRRLLGEG